MAKQRKNQTMARYVTPPKEMNSAALKTMNSAARKQHLPFTALFAHRQNEIIPIIKIPPPRKNLVFYNF